MANTSGSWRFGEDGSYVERDCLLFEVGEYPDRGVTVTPDDLLAIVENTEAEVPVKVEHLARSPFDGALGSVGNLRAVGHQLFGTLRQPIEAWQFVQRAGARSLSIALDAAARKIAEVSFVSCPRVAGARVFASNPQAKPEGCALFESPCVFQTGDGTEEEKMVSVRQFADGLMQYMRGVLGPDSPQPEQFSRDFAAERAQLDAEREALATERAERRIESLKRRGLIRATPEVEAIASALLRFGVTNVVQFSGDQVSMDKLVLRLLEANGPVVPMGELAAAFPDTCGASDRLISLARDLSRKDNLPYLTAFSRVSADNPELARAAREE
jgi:hypothetical protein